MAAFGLGCGLAVRTLKELHEVENCNCTYIHLGNCPTRVLPRDFFTCPLDGTWFVSIEHDEDHTRTCVNGHVYRISGSRLERVP